eukprot:jgi/Ulvmu1/3247/UM150_0020.1
MSSKLKLGYLVPNFLFLGGWAVALVGLSLVQKECNNNQEQGFYTGSSFTSIEFFTGPIGEDCRQAFRFFWFVLALDSIPALLAIIAAVKPEYARGVSSSFFAVIAPLNILMANAFYNAFDPQVFGLSEDMERFMKIVMVGFCLLSTAALLMLMADGLLSGVLNRGSDSNNKDNSVRVQVVEKTARGTTTFEV